MPKEHSVSIPTTCNSDSTSPFVKIGREPVKSNAIDNLNLDFKRDSRIL